VDGEPSEELEIDSGKQQGGLSGAQAAPVGERQLGNR